MEPAKPFSAAVYTKSGCTPCSRATAAGFVPSRSVTMKRPGMICSDAPALNAGASCGASPEEASDGDVVGESAHAASTPAMTNADASRLTEVRDIGEILTEERNASTRTSGRKTLWARTHSSSVRDVAELGAAMYVW